MIIFACKHTSKRNTNKSNVTHLNKGEGLFNTLASSFMSSAASVVGKKLTEKVKEKKHDEESIQDYVRRMALSTSRCYRA